MRIAGKIGAYLLLSRFIVDRSERLLTFRGLIDVNQAVWCPQQQRRLFSLSGLVIVELHFSPSGGSFKLIIDDLLRLLSLVHVIAVGLIDDSLPLVRRKPVRHVDRHLQ